MSDQHPEHVFDAIVVGSGISGGWAAKELCDKGLKTLVLDRGKEVKHIKDYPTAMKAPWEFPHRGRLPLKVLEENPIAAKCYAYDETAAHFFLKDKDQPYIQEKPFDWIRPDQVGGKSLMWGRQTQRWSRYDFEGPARDGFAVEWPFTYEELAPWYSYVELFAGISGNRDGLDTLPDGEFLPPWEMNRAEQAMRVKIEARHRDRNVIIGRCAHLTEIRQVHRDQGRMLCQARHLCQRGCPFGGYFSSNASTLPWAAKTGNLTLRPDSIVHSVIYDDVKGKATGVNVIDVHTKKMTAYYAKIIFLNASTLSTNQVLLNSVSRRFPNGLGNDNGLLGKYIAFQNYRGRLSASLEGMEDRYYSGKRPCAVMMPNFRNVHRQEKDFQRGYMVFFSTGRAGWGHAVPGEQAGPQFKTAIADPGDWGVYMMMQGETIPREANHVRLSKDHMDPWGIPQLITSVDYDENDERLLKDFLDTGAEMLETCGAKNIAVTDTKQAPGLDIHEVGGVRMGKDPATSLLNKWNQLHHCPNVLVTDGSCMVSTSTQNPSLTFMAITARAANHVIEELKKGNL